MALKHPEIDPVILKLWGPFQIRWYSVLYVGGFIVGGFLARYLAKKDDRFKLTEKDAEEFPMWVLLGAVIGARIIYCFVYDPSSLMQNPFYLFQVYKGGLSFHGGLMGAMVALWIFAKKRNIPYLNFLDLCSICACPGLAMGRMGNFINGELWGRTTDVPWGMVFQGAGNLPRHPSQLYELFLEGICLFSLLWFLKNRLTKDGSLAVVFLLAYSSFRFIVEFFREPDSQVGYLLFSLTMGQWLCVIMFAVSSLWGWWIFKRSPQTK